MEVEKLCANREKPHCDIGNNKVILPSKLSK
jgi:hypothetical protein